MARAFGQRPSAFLLADRSVVERYWFDEAVFLWGRRHEAAAPGAAPPPAAAAGDGVQAVLRNGQLFGRLTWAPDAED